MRHLIVVSVEHDDPATAERAVTYVRHTIHRVAGEIGGGVADLVLREDRDFDYTGASQALERRQVAAIFDQMRGRARQAVADPRPHARACGRRLHPHGTHCSLDCPTCGGRAE